MRSPLIVSMGDTMRRLILLFLVLTFVSSCGRESSPAVPEPFAFPMRVEAHLSCEAGNARVVIEYESEEHYTVRYTEPKVMTGIVYGIDADGAYMTFKESRIPVTEGEACFSSLAIGRLICPRGEDTVQIEYEDGLPVRAEGTVDGFKAALTEIIIQGR